MKYKYITVTTDNMFDGTSASLIKGDLLLCNHMPKACWKHCQAVVYVRGLGVCIGNFKPGESSSVITFLNSSYTPLQLQNTDIVAVYSVEYMQRNKDVELGYLEERINSDFIKPEQRRCLQLRMNYAIKKRYGSRFHNA